MSVAGASKLEALHRLLQSAPRVDVKKASATGMHRAQPQPQVMGNEFSGIERAFGVYHGKCHTTDRNVLTAGVDAACLNS